MVAEAEEENVEPILNPTFIGYLDGLPVVRVYVSAVDGKQVALCPYCGKPHKFHEWFDGEELGICIINFKHYWYWTYQPAPEAPS